MGFNRVAIIGADCVSVSLGLALKAQQPAPAVVGYDANPLRARIAREMGAFDRIEPRFERVVPREAELVLIALPLAELRAALAELAEHLPAGCLVTDTARLKGPVMEWAATLLPPGVHFAGGHVLLNPATAGLRNPHDMDIEEASASLLKGALYCFTPTPHTPTAVINRLTELAAIAEAQPFFVDVIEHDGLQAGVDELPDLLAVALTLATVDSPGWQEMRKFARARFAAATETDEERGEYRSAIFLNRENLVLRLNGLLTELIRLRELLTQGDAKGLEQAFATAAARRAGWIEETKRGMWGQEGGPSMEDVPTSGEHMARLLVGERAIQRLRGPRRRPR